MTGADPTENAVVGRIAGVGDRDSLEGREGWADRTFDRFRLCKSLIILVVGIIEGLGRKVGRRFCRDLRGGVGRIGGIGESRGGEQILKVRRCFAKNGFVDPELTSDAREVEADVARDSGS